ncbi:MULTISPECIES: DUF6273 domain-containing protein [Enorma]|uniref:DUF6273 domain-containing protein n=1 Tax=Enorma TaxID=1472762 RepID=UPI00034BF5CD|nr:MULTISPECIES: DUF6273 domain-containing protein [Enorma]
MIIFGFGYDKDGFDKHGFDREGYDRLGFNTGGWNREGYGRDGYDHDGYDRDGYDRDGYDRDGYDKNGYDLEGFDGHGYNLDGYDRNGFGRDGYNAKGYNRRGYNREGYDIEGFDSDGFNKRGFDRDGYDVAGLDAQGYGRDGYNLAGYDRDGFDHYGYNCNGFDRNGFDSEGFDEDGYDRSGFDAEGYTKSGFDCFGYDRDGFDYYGYNAAGFDRNGYDRKGFDSEGFDRNGYDNRGFDRAGYDKDGLDEEGYDRHGFDKRGFDKFGYDKEGFNARGFDVHGMHRNGTQFDQDGYDSNGLNEIGLDVDGFNGNGLNPSEIESKGHLDYEVIEEEINPIVRRAYLMCEDGDFSKADELVEKALNSNPEDGNAYLAALMIEKRVTNEDQLACVGAFDFKDLTESANYSKAIRFGSRKLKARLGAYAQRNKELINDWLLLDKDELRGRLLIMSRYAVSFDYGIPHDREESLETDNVASIPGNYITWEDSAVRKWLNSTYLNSLPRFIKDRIMESEVYTAGTERNWSHYPKSWQIPACTTWDKIFSLSVDEVQRYYWNKRDRIAHYKGREYAAVWGLRSPGFFKVAGYHAYELGWDSMTDGGAIVCYGNFSVGDGMWGSAFGTAAGGYEVDRYMEGTRIGHRPAMWIDDKVAPSDARVKNWFSDFTIAYPEDIRTGATRNIAFGGYLWRVLEVVGDAALLITENIVRSASYTEKSIEGVERSPSIDWKSSPVRRWLNGEFVKEMDENAVQRILSKKNITHDSAFIKKAPAYDDSFPLRHSEYEPQVTLDKVFCLDPFEAAKYFSDDADRISMHTGDTTAWHLRSYSKEIEYYAYGVSGQGSVGLGVSGTAVANLGIRPAVWIRLP